MGICTKSKPIAAALLAFSGLGATSLSADGRFIVQPSLCKPAPEAVQPLPEIETGPVVIAAVPLSTESLSFESLAAPVSLAPANAACEPIVQPVLPHPELPAWRGHANLSPAPAAVGNRGQAVAHPPQGTASPPQAASDSRQGLQWITRGARPGQTTEPQSTPPMEASRRSIAPVARLASPPIPTVPEREANQANETLSPPFSLTSSRATTPGGDADMHGSAESQRAVLASLVSHQITSNRPAAGELGRPVHSIDSPPGWQAVGEELSQRLGKCEALINRRAYFSAREDAETAMLYLVRVLDLRANHYYSEPAWHAASKAMSEAEDFSNAQRLTSDSDFLRRVILSHETPVLKDADATALAPLAAAQHYRQYAEEKLAEAAQGHPWASEVLYALGRSYQSHADATQAGLQQNLRWRAITLYRAARAIAPGNATATNQLGFVLLQMDRPADAREALVASLNAAPSLAAYQNLVEASRRLGDTGTGNWAMQQALAAKNTLSMASSAPEFVEVDPRTFAAMSPYSIGPNPPAHDTAAPTHRTAFSNPTNH